MSDQLLYFAYGSNLLSQRLRDRVPDARVVARIELAGWSMRFDKLSRDGSGKCNMYPAPAEALHGVLYQVAEDQLAPLERAEHGYDRVELDLGPHGAAFSYRAPRENCRDDLLPYDWYLGLVLAGGREHAFPEAWFERYLGHPSQLDPEFDRAAQHLALIASSR